MPTNHELERIAFHEILQETLHDEGGPVQVDAAEGSEFLSKFCKRMMKHPAWAQLEFIERTAQGGQGQ